MFAKNNESKQRRADVLDEQVRMLGFWRLIKYNLFLSFTSACTIKTLQTLIYISLQLSMSAF